MTDHTLGLRGGWVMITRKLPTEVSPPLLSVWYAQPDRLFSQGWHVRWPDSERGDELSQTELTLLWRIRNGGRVLPHERDSVKKWDDVPLDQRVRIACPEGQAWVEPHEWTPVQNIDLYFDMVDGEHVKLHLLGGGTSGSVADQLFYIMSRGISKAVAYGMLLGEIRKPNICWLEIHQYYADFFLAPRERKRTLREAMKITITDGNNGSHELSWR